ncbi:MAG: GNAT family N-acetyltransferase [Rhodomicrobiaceae bacterium]
MSNLEAAGTAAPVFREARETDLPAILALLADDPLGKYREMSVPDGAQIPAGYRVAFEAITADPRNLMIVAELDGAVAGCLQLTFIPGLTYSGGERVLIEAVRIRKDLRGAGLGRALMSHVVELARSRGAVLVQLATDKRRAGAIAFYRSLGFAASHEGMKLRF